MRIALVLALCVFPPAAACAVEAAAATTAPAAPFKATTRPSRRRPAWQDRWVTRVEFPIEEKRYWWYSTSDPAINHPKFYQFQMPDHRWAFAATGAFAGDEPASLVLIYRGADAPGEGREQTDGREAAETTVEEAWLLQHRGEDEPEDVLWDFVKLSPERRRAVEWAFALEGKATVSHKDGLLRRASIAGLESGQEILPSRELLVRERDAARHRVEQLEKEVAAGGDKRAREELQRAKRDLPFADRLAEHGWKGGLRAEREAGQARVRALEADIAAGRGDAARQREALRREKAFVDLVTEALQSDRKARFRGEIKGTWVKRTGKSWLENPL